MQFIIVLNNKNKTMLIVLQHLTKCTKYYSDI